MFKIALTAGHYKYTSGKRCDAKLDPNETREWVLNDRIADKIENLLREYDGYSLLRTDDTTGEKAIEVKDRTKAANNFKADVYISIHHNAGIKRGSGGGIVAYTYTKVDNATKAWQKELYNSLIKHTGLKGNRANPLAMANFEECRKTNMPAVLLELGFMDSKTDVPVILTDDYANKCAKAIVEVIVAKANLKKKNTEKAVLYRVRKTWKDASSQIGAFLNLDNAISAAKSYNLNVYDEKGNVVFATQVKTKSITEIAKEVLIGKWGNGPDRKKRLTNAGYNYSKVQNEVNRLLKK